MKWDELNHKPIFNMAKLMAVFLLAALAFYMLARLAGLLAPFVAGLICSMAMEPFVRLITKKTKSGKGLPRSIASLIALLIMGALFALLLTLLIGQLIAQTISLAQYIPKIIPDLLSQVNRLLSWLEEEIALLPFDVPEELFSIINNSLYSITSELTKYANTLARSVWSIAATMPVMFLFIVMWLVSTYYFSAWRLRISKFMSNSFPTSWIKRVWEIRKRLFSTLYGYIRAQMLIMVAVFFVVMTGLSILRIEYALLLAIACAFFDMLPLIGAGLMLNTWAAYCLATGDAMRALGLFLTWIAVTLARNFLEPRLVSAQIGLPPLMTMLAMYSGFLLIGFLGLIGGPLLLLVLQIVYEYYARGRTLQQVIIGEDPPAAVEPSPPDTPPPA